MQYEKCCCCGLILPIIALVPIIVLHQGKRIRVPICTVCKAKKEQEAKGKPNENN